jgi:prophage regulatory protein
MPFCLKSSPVGIAMWSKFIAGKPSWSPAMTNDAIDRPRADVERARLPYLRIGLVMSLTGLGRSTIYRLMADDQFPPPVRHTKRIVVWRRADVEQWFETRPVATH